MQYAQYVVMAMLSYITVSWLAMDAKDSSDEHLLENIDMYADLAISASLINVNYLLKLGKKIYSNVEGGYHTVLYCGHR